MDDGMAAVMCTDFKMLSGVHPARLEAWSRALRHNKVPSHINQTFSFFVSLVGLFSRCNEVGILPIVIEAISERQTRTLGVYVLQMV